MAKMPAGAVKAAKRKTAAKKTPPKKVVPKKTPPKKTPPKVTAPKPPATPKPTTVSEPKAPVKVPTTPVANSNGSLVSPQTWQQDQTRLAYARQDQDEQDRINEEELAANTEYNTQQSQYETEMKQRKLDIAKQRDEFLSTKNRDAADLNSSLSYRGASRSSAAMRKIGELRTQQEATSNALNTAETEASTSFANANPALLNAKNAKMGLLAKRRLTLAGRGSAGGIYTAGTKPVVSTGVSAQKPVSIPKPPAKAPAKPPAKAPVKKAPVKKAPAKKAPPKKASTKKNTAAARRKLGRK